LPLRSNDGQPIPPEFIKLTITELLARFDGMTMGPQHVAGIWQQDGVRYEDELLRFVVDVEDSEENQFFFVNFKTVLLERFQQIEIYIVSYPIDRI
jgi:hypothetical protein